MLSGVAAEEKLMTLQEAFFNTLKWFLAGCAVFVAFWGVISI